jgi:hypothetical protein
MYKVTNIEELIKANIVEYAKDPVNRKRLISTDVAVGDLIYYITDFTPEEKKELVFTCIKNRRNIPDGFIVDGNAVNEDGNTPEMAFLVQNTRHTPLMQTNFDIINKNGNTLAMILVMHKLYEKEKHEHLLNSPDIVNNSNETLASLFLECYGSIPPKAYPKNVDYVYCDDLTISMKFVDKLKRLPPPELFQVNPNLLNSNKETFMVMAIGSGIKITEFDEVTQRLCPDINITYSRGNNLLHIYAFYTSSSPPSILRPLATVKNDLGNVPYFVYMSKHKALPPENYNIDPKLVNSDGNCKMHFQAFYLSQITNDALPGKDMLNTKGQFPYSYLLMRRRQDHINPNYLPSKEVIKTMNHNGMTIAEITMFWCPNIPKAEIDLHFPDRTPNEQNAYEIQILKTKRRQNVVLNKYDDEKEDMDDMYNSSRSAMYSPPPFGAQFSYAYKPNARGASPPKPNPMSLETCCQYIKKHLYGVDGNIRLKDLFNDECKTYDIKAEFEDFCDFISEPRDTVADEDLECIRDAEEAVKYILAKFIESDKY